MSCLFKYCLSVSPESFGSKVGGGRLSSRRSTASLRTLVTGNGIVSCTMDDNGMPSKGSLGSCGTGDNARNCVPEVSVSGFTTGGAGRRLSFDELAPLLCVVAFGVVGPVVWIKGGGSLIGMDIFAPVSLHC